MYSMSSRLFRFGSKYSIAPFTDIGLVPVRNLFSRQELGVTQLERLRDITINEFKSSRDIEVFKDDIMKDFSTFRLDKQRDALKKFMLCIDGQPKELDILKSILLEFQKNYNNNIHSVSEYHFGPQIMRLLYILNLPDYAVKFYKDEDLKDVSEQMSTYKVLLSLLFENRRYAEVFELYDNIQKRLDLFEKIPDITINCLAFAACYQLNTPNHFKYAQELWERTEKFRQLNRSKQFLAGLALKQNRPDIALSLVPEASTYASVRFIKLMAFTQLGEIDNACDVLRQTISNYKMQFNKNKPDIGRQMVDDLQILIKNSGNDKQLNTFNDIHAELILLGLVNEETLDQRLCASFPPMLPKTIFNKLKKKTMSSTILYAPERN